MTKEELFVLDWLGKEDTSAYGECKGSALDALVVAGLAQVGPSQAGRSDDYRRVWLTEAGRQARAALSPEGH